MLGFQIQIMTARKSGSPRRSGLGLAQTFDRPPPVVLGPPEGAPPLRVIRAVTVRYIRRWLVGWLLFRCLAPGFAGRALVLGNRPTGAGRFRVAGGRRWRAGGPSSGRRNRKRGRSEKIRMKRKGGARITRDGCRGGGEPNGGGVSAVRGASDQTTRSTGGSFGPKGAPGANGSGSAPSGAWRMKSAIASRQA